MIVHGYYKVAVWLYGDRRLCAIPDWIPAPDVGSPRPDAPIVASALSWVFPFSSVGEREAQKDASFRVHTALKACGFEPVLEYYTR